MFHLPDFPSIYLPRVLSIGLNFPVDLLTSHLTSPIKRQEGPESEALGGFSWVANQHTAPGPIPNHRKASQA